MLPPTTPPSPPFLEAQSAAREGMPALLGVPFDATASFRLGARFGPEAIREASDGLESYSPGLDRDLLEQPFADLGNLVIPSDDGAYH